MRATLLRLTVMLTLLTALLAATPVAGAAQGNSDSAQACRSDHGAVIGTDGTVFGSVGECVRHAAQGGTLVSTEAAGPCLDGGWATLAPAEDDTTAFADLAACLTYVAGGGAPVPVRTDSVPEGPTATAWAGTLDASQYGAGLCGGHYVFGNLQAGVTYRIVAYRGDGSVWVTRDFSLTGSQHSFGLQYLITPLLVPGETTWAELYLATHLGTPIAVSNTATCPA